MACCPNAVDERRRFRRTSAKGTEVHRHAVDVGVAVGCRIPGRRHDVADNEGAVSPGATGRNGDVRSRYSRRLVVDAEVCIISDIRRDVASIVRRRHLHRSRRRIDRAGHDRVARLPDLARLVESAHHGAGRAEFGEVERHRGDIRIAIGRRVPRHRDHVVLDQHAIQSAAGGRCDDLLRRHRGRCLIQNNRAA